LRNVQALSNFFRAVVRNFSVLRLASSLSLVQSFKHLFERDLTVGSMEIDKRCFGNHEVL
jgi:hypothetical protein